VFDGPQRSLAGGDASQLELDDGFPTITAPSPLVMIPQQLFVTVNHLQADGVGSSLSHVREPSTPQSIVSTAEMVTTAARRSVDNDPHTAWTSDDLPDDISYPEATPQQLIDKHSWQQRSTNRQSAVLRFRYQVIPWIESNSCKSMFGPTVMTLARDSNLISGCIHACVRTRDQNHDLSSTTSTVLAVRSELLERLTREDTLTAEVGFALLTISSAFYTPPSEWAVIVATCEARLGQSVMSSGGFELTPEPLKTLLRLQLKVGKP
jgi:hypothetical protein